MNIYLSSSWQNRERVRTLAEALRAAGHEVYDFTDETSRKALDASCIEHAEIPPERFPEQFDPKVQTYSSYITAVPEWRAAVNRNREALAWCDAVVLLLPCGNDAHADAYYALGLGKHLAVVGQPKAGDRTPAHLWANAILDWDTDVQRWAAGIDQFLVAEKKAEQLAKREQSKTEVSRSGSLPAILPADHGGHNYGELDGTKDCMNGCGSWMGPCRSRAPKGIDPFGVCPKAPRKAAAPEHTAVLAAETPDDPHCRTCGSTKRLFFYPGGPRGIWLCPACSARDGAPGDMWTVGGTNSALPCQAEPPAPEPAADSRIIDGDTYALTLQALKDGAALAKLQTQALLEVARHGAGHCSCPTADSCHQAIHQALERALGPNWREKLDRGVKEAT